MSVSSDEQPRIVLPVGEVIPPPDGLAAHDGVSGPDAVPENGTEPEPGAEPESGVVAATDVVHRGLDRQYRVLIDHTPDAIVVHEGQQLVFVNPAGLRLIGAARADQVVGHPLAEFVDQQSVQALRRRISSLDEQGAASEPTEMVLRRIGGRQIDVEARSVLTVWDDKPAYLALLRDLSAQRAAEAAADSAERLFTTVVSTLDEGVIVLDGAGVVKSINTAAKDILRVGDDVIDAVEPGRLRDRLSVTTTAGAPLAEDDFSLIRTQRTRSPAKFVNHVRRPDGTSVWTSGTSKAIFSGADLRVVVSFGDITTERENTARLAYQANHDSLTNLPNRLKIVEALGTTLDDTERGAMAVLFIDLDNLKTVNDSLGHSVGDDVLREVGVRLRAVVPADGIVGRVGGDEFVAMAHLETTDQLDALTTTIHSALAAPIEIDGWTLGMTASIGVVNVPTGDLRSIDDLLRDADLAMYDAKSAGGQRTVHFATRHRRDRSSR